MRVLSLTATSRLAERCIRMAGEPMLVSDLIARLESLDVDTERAQAGIRLASSRSTAATLRSCLPRRSAGASPAFNSSRGGGRRA